MKKKRLHFFLQAVQKVQKMFGIFSPKSKQLIKKIIRHNHFQLWGSQPPPLYPRFRRVLRPLHPLQGLLPPKPGWKTIDWNSNQLILMYSWSTFLNRVRFLNFWHFYDPIFKQISEATFFMIITIYWYFIHCEEKEFCSKIFKAQKMSFFRNSKRSS